MIFERYNPEIPTVLPLAVVQVFERHAEEFAAYGISRLECGGGAPTATNAQQAKVEPRYSIIARLPSELSAHTVAIDSIFAKVANELNSQGFPFRVTPSHFVPGEAGAWATIMYGPYTPPAFAR